MSSIRDATSADTSRVMDLDAVAAAGDGARQAAIEHWIADGSMRVAVAADEIVGYCVTERAFFGHWFVVMLMVAEAARSQGVGAELLLDVQRERAAAKLFTSTNLSNQPMQRVLARLGWRSAGIVYGLDEGDPELFYLARMQSPRPADSCAYRLPALAQERRLYASRHTGTGSVTSYDCAVTERMGGGFIARHEDRVAEPGQSPDSVRLREPDPVVAELRERMDRLPPGHPSSSYNDDGSRKPPPPDLSEYELPIPGDPDYQPDAPRAPEADQACDNIRDHESPAADRGLDKELPHEDQEGFGDLDAREQAERRLSQISDRTMGRCRAAEGRDADGNYGEKGLTPAMRQIESQLEHGHLAAQTEEHALKSPGRFKEKLAERIERFPNADPDDLAAEIHDGVRYTFILDFDYYTDGVGLAQDKLAEAGYDHIETKPGWHGDELKG